MLLRSVIYGAEFNFVLLNDFSYYTIFFGSSQMLVLVVRVL